VLTLCSRVGLPGQLLILKKIKIQKTEKIKPIVLKSSAFKAFVQ
jgi:hypothetical protein